MTEQEEIKKLRQKLTSFAFAGIYRDMHDHCLSLTYKKNKMTSDDIGMAYHSMFVCTHAFNKNFSEFAETVARLIKLDESDKEIGQNLLQLINNLAGHVNSIKDYLRIHNYKAISKLIDYEIGNRLGVLEENLIKLSSKAF